MKKIYYLVLFSFIFLTIFTLYKYMFVNNKYYEDIYQEKTNVYVESLSTPRGRILDINGNVLVDNKGIKTIVYRKLNNISTNDEINIAYLLADILSFDKAASITELKKFWILQNKDEADSLISEEEYKKYEERKLTSNDLFLLKMDRITEEMLNSFNELDRNASHIYSLMNSGYYYDAKIIKQNVTDLEYANLTLKNISGITNEMYFERYYPYGNTLKKIFGSVGSIPASLKNEYLEKGYSLNDYVGTSYLEMEYEDYLKGEKDVYRVNKDGTLSLVNEGKRGNDLVLSIDINMQLDIENILKEQIMLGKKELNTEYYTGSYILVGDVRNGEILAMVGLKYVDNDVYLNSETDMITSSFTVGSVVKGASMAMAYQNNLIDVGKKIKDSCVKLYLVPQKCSYKSLGYIDDITALKTSSNYYQFLLAIALANQKYTYNMDLKVSEREFDIYRNTFASFGLGSSTGIDLPNEAIGIKGEKISGDLLLNLAIGQYDTYTPVQLLQYINTIANNGVRYKLSLMNHIADSNGNIVLSNNHEILNEYNLAQEYFDRIHEGLFQVVNLGTGYGYTNTIYKAAGKTGTSESFYDSDNDQVSDVKTITSTYAMYAPVDSPKYSMVVVSPNVSHYNGKTDHFAYINRSISNAVSDYIFSR